MDPKIPDQAGVCLGERTIASFVGGVLERDDVTRVEIHLADCAACRAVVADAAFGAAPSGDGADTDVDGAAPAAQVLPFRLPERGEVIAGKYRVEEPLGRGGMGAVFAARHIELGNRVALKILFRGERVATARFLREAQTCARLTGENIVRVSDVGRLEGGTPYLVMEYLTGSDLGRVMKLGPVAIADAVSYVLDACTGLAEAHAIGVVHRDLKPVNLFLTTRGDGSTLVKVLDFGISKLLHDGGNLSLTASLAFMGTPSYMSPEQVRDSKDVDERTDVWSLGVILYVLLTGKTPFPGPTVAEISVQILSSIPARPSSLRADVPPALDAAILRCLEKDRANRYAHLADLTHDLAPFAPPDGDARAERVARFGGRAPKTKPLRNERAWVVALIGGVLLAGAIGVGAMESGGNATPMIVPAAAPVPITAASSWSVSAVPPRPSERDADSARPRRITPL